MQASCLTQFTGHKAYKLDPKGRVSFPSHWKTGDDKIFKVIAVTRESYPLLKCYTEESFDRMVNRVNSRAEARNFTDRQITQYLERIIGDCFDAELNTQGKLLISKDQRAKMELEDQVMIVGRGDYYELWKPEAYQAVYDLTRSQHMQLDEIFGILS